MMLSVKSLSVISVSMALDWALGTSHFALYLRHKRHTEKNTAGRNAGGDRRTRDRHIRAHCQSSARNVPRAFILGYVTPERTEGSKRKREKEQERKRERDGGRTCAAQGLDTPRFLRERTPGAMLRTDGPKCAARGFAT